MGGDEYSSHDTRIFSPSPGLFIGIPYAYDIPINSPCFFITKKDKFD